MPPQAIRALCSAGGGLWLLGAISHSRARTTFVHVTTSRGISGKNARKSRARENPGPGARARDAPPRAPPESPGGGTPRAQRRSQETTTLEFSFQEQPDLGRMQSPPNPPLAPGPRCRWPRVVAKGPELIWCGVKMTIGHPKRIFFASARPRPCKNVCSIQEQRDVHGHNSAGIAALYAGISPLNCCRPGL